MNLASIFTIPPFRNLIRFFLFLLIAGLTNGLLIRQNRQLKAAAVIGKAARIPQAGESVPALSMKTPSGQQRMINYSDHPKTVLLAYSSQCSACERVLPYWKEIERVCARNQYQILAISLDNGPNAESFLRSKGLDLEALIDSEATAKDDYKLNVIPLTIVIDSKGIVERIRMIDCRVHRACLLRGRVPICDPYLGI